MRENIRRMAAEKGITLKELAKKVGIPDVRMMKIMNTDTQLRLIEIVNLLIYFDCKPSELYGKKFTGGNVNE